MPKKIVVIVRSSSAYQIRNTVSEQLKTDIRKKLHEKYHAVL